MILVETGMFSKCIDDLLDEDEYRELQIALVQRPDIGAVIQGTGGLRKARWLQKSHGKRGGVRIIYYWAEAKNQIYLLHCFAKNQQVDLTAYQRKVLKSFVTQWLYEED